ncbi:hypothetical protein C3942_11770 [Solimonas fluminis]|uniref:Carboxymuconolactone decarboxylase-like domain-containing protein n=1 Tax=Solimonas fluminis TaxID=2086571 RepID=A0A2S5TER4_9GAMM|nr:hypothetical protein [Solimonas fluminis]PPE73481.1 hypothetical protein C3942_11770 [Solimonas fluminis]
MIKPLINSQISKFERAYDYDMSYARELLAADLKAVLLFNKVMPLAKYHRDIPVDAWFTAKIVGGLHEDCGPCTQLVVRMAEQAGVPAETLRAVVGRRPEQLPPDARLAYRFAEASLARSPEADPLREQVLQRWGRRALVSIAFALVAARIFPTLKYALGYGKTCLRVEVGGRPQAVTQTA